MHIQQIRQERKQVVGSDGRTFTKTEAVPAIDAISLSHGGKTYPTEGNGVFHVPDELGQELLGGLFRDVSGVRGKSIVLTHPGGEPPSLIPGKGSLGYTEPEEEIVGPNAAAPLPEGTGATTEAAAAKATKPAKKRAPRKKAAPKG